MLNFSNELARLLWCGELLNRIVLPIFQPVTVTIRFNSGLIRTRFSKILARKDFPKTLLFENHNGKYTVHGLTRCVHGTKI